MTGDEGEATAAIGHRFTRLQPHPTPGRHNTGHADSQPAKGTTNTNYRGIVLALC